jgi:hypothetical protein
MTVDTSTAVLDTSKAAAPDLAWSLDGDDAVLDFPADQPQPDDDEPAAGERYSWWLVWRYAALLVVVAAALAAVLVSVRDRREVPSTPAVAPPPTVAAPPTVYPRAPAAAPVDPDSVFLTELGIAGIPVTNTTAAVNGGRGVCADIAAGGTPQQEVQVVVRNNSLVTPAEARMYIAAAIDAYCP